MHAIRIFIVLCIFAAGQGNALKCYSCAGKTCSDENLNKTFLKNCPERPNSMDSRLRRFCSITLISTRSDGVRRPYARECTYGITAGLNKGMSANVWYCETDGCNRGRMTQLSICIFLGSVIISVFSSLS